MLKFSKETFENYFKWQMEHPMVADVDLVEDFQAIINSVKTSTVEVKEGVPIYKYFTKKKDEYRLKYTDNLDAANEALNSKSISSVILNGGIPVFVIK
jgi:hypothetical protein